MKLIKNSLIYLSSEILNKSIPFLLLPIITKYLTPVEYGIYGMYQVMLAFLTPFVSISLDIHITRNFFKVSKDEIKKILNSIILILTLNVLLALVLIFFVSIFFHNPLGIPNKTLYIIPLIIYAQTINVFNLTILRNEEKAFKYGLFQFMITIINFGLVLILLFFFNEKWLSLVYGMLFSNLIVSFFSFKRLQEEFKLNFKSFYPFKKIYVISLPLIFHLIGGSIIFLSDRIFIQQMLGLKEVGLYSVGNRLGSVALIVINAIVMAITPWMYKNLASKSFNLRNIYFIMVLFFILGILIWQFLLIIFPYLIDKKYSYAKLFIIWFSLAFVFRGWYQLFYNMIVHFGKTKVFLYITTSAALLNLILDYVLIKYEGAIGAAQATCFSFLFMFFAVFIYLKIKYGDEL